MRADLPTVSVVIPVFNGARHLAEAIGSVRAQSCRAAEILVVDDGSTDASADIAASFSEVTLLRQANAGVSAARNAGIAASMGECVAFLDADDVWTPSKLATHIHYHSAHPETDFSVAHMHYFVTGRSDTPAWLSPDCLGTENVGYLPSNLFATRRALERIGGFDPQFRVGEGAEWFARAKDFGAHAAILPEVLLLRRVHPDNVSNNLARVRSGVLHGLKASIDRQRRTEQKP